MPGAIPAGAGAPLRVAVGALLLAVLAVAVPSPSAAQLVGSISGVVSAGGRPLPHVWVVATPVTPLGERAGRGFTTATDDEGRYTFPDVYWPHVKVEARAPALSAWATTYWPGASTFAEAEVLGVASAGSRADIALAHGGRVRGVVVAEASGRPIAGVRVTAHVLTPAGPERVGTSGLGSARGRFVVDALPPVPIILRAEPPAGTTLRPQWFDGVRSPAEATPVAGSLRSSGLRVVLGAGRAAQPEGVPERRTGDSTADDRVGSLGQAGAGGDDGGCRGSSAAAPASRDPEDRLWPMPGPGFLGGLPDWARLG